MAEKVDCLFSLELVVDKLYLPHIVCRFPALAFRLLDFPTILVRHVEADHEKRIKGKISDDPDYQVPHQFPELKDKHSNFMVKKGKSCLFKISLESLRVHLTSTPLYVMVVDTFTDVPKLLGNSTVPLDAIIESIHTDVSKVGNSIPSVHGDKGLFKIYNLMGKEIGYVILGYRLLSIGPSLVPHLADQVLHVAERGGKSEELPELDTKPNDNDLCEENRPTSKTAWTATEQMPQKDALMQTDEFEKHDKNVTTDSVQPEIQDPKIVHSISTQTAKNKKKYVPARQQPQRDQMTLIDHNETDEEAMFTNTCKPPPLFYTGKKDSQTIWLSRRSGSPHLSESQFEDYSDIVSDYGENKELNKQSLHENSLDYAKNSNKRNVPENKKFLSSEPTQQSAIGNNVFPLLSALIQEISRLQIPHAQANAAQLSLFNMAGVSAPQLVNRKTEPTKTIQISQDKHQPSEKGDLLDKDECQNSPGHKSGRLSHRSCCGDQQGVPKNKSWLRKTPEQGIKKSKLTFGMTNTQRLRLAKANPKLHKAMDERKGKVDPTQQLKPPQEEFEEGNLSDMSTEIRRHTLDDTDLEDMAKDQFTSFVKDNVNKNQNIAKSQKTEPDKTRVSFNESVDKMTISSPQRRKKVNLKHGSPKSSRKSEKVTKSPSKLGKKKPEKSGLKSNIVASNSNEDNNQVTDTGTEDTPRKGVESGDVGAEEVLVPDLPQYVPPQMDSTDSEEDYGALTNRSQKSIEVRLPSAEPQSDDLTSPERPENGGVKMNKIHSFAGFPKKSDDYWESSLEMSKPVDQSDDELGSSYVPSWGFDGNVDKRHRSSGVFSSTGELDTRQFHSTDEPELLDLISDGESEDITTSSDHSAQAAISEEVSGKTKSSEKGSVSTVLRIPILNPQTSESSPVPSTRRSVARAEFNTSAAQHTEPTEQLPKDSKRPTPRPRSRKGRELEKKESLHTESISTYAPSDADNMNTSLASDPTYSEDFHQMGSDDDLRNMSPLPSYPRLIPSTKLGYTIT